MGPELLESLRDVGVIVNPSVVQEDQDPLLPQGAVIVDALQSPVDKVLEEGGVKGPLNYLG